MTADKKETKVEQPAFDPNKLLDQLQELVKSKSKSVDPAHGGTKRVGSSWIWKLILPLVVLIGIAAFAWFANKSNRELAKLRHEKNKAKILKDQAVVQAKIATNDEYIAEQQKIYDAAQERIKIIDADIAAGEKQYEADLRAIDSIRSWDDYRLRRRPDPKP
jgi:uncharacterized protein HemX